MTSSATFSNARAGCLSAATDLYGTGSTQYNVTVATWTA
ncbi:MAG: M4 family metallopeptidase [Chloroflexi bacterium SZAS-1]|nr:M4 family metallopeptidase [Chloroflexi bacterium SZAS-1]